MFESRISHDLHVSDVVIADLERYLNEVGRLALNFVYSYDINMQVPMSFLIPALIYWHTYNLEVRVYSTDRQLT